MEGTRVTVERRRHEITELKEWMEGARNRPIRIQNYFYLSGQTPEGALLEFLDKSIKEKQDREPFAEEEKKRLAEKAAPYIKPGPTVDVAKAQALPQNFEFDPIHSLVDRYVYLGHANLPRSI